MYKRRKLYPSPKRWLLFILPGTLFAVAGLVVNATFETDKNYFWVHSTWHLCMGLGVLFLIPPRDRKCKNEYHPMSELVDINAMNTELIHEDPGYWSRNSTSGLKNSTTRLLMCGAEEICVLCLKMQSNCATRWVGPASCQI